MKETKVGLSWASLSFSLGAPFLCFCHFLVPLAPHSQKYSLRYFTVSKYRLSLWLSLPYETEEPLMPPSPGFRLLKKNYSICCVQSVWTNLRKICLCSLILSVYTVLKASVSSRLPDWLPLTRSMSLVMGISLMGFFMRHRVSSEVPKQLGR